MFFLAAGFVGRADLWRGLYFLALVIPRLRKFPPIRVPGPGRGLIPIPGSVAVLGRVRDAVSSPSKSSWRKRRADGAWCGGDTSPMAWLTQVNVAFTRVNLMKRRGMSGENACCTRNCVHERERVEKSR